MDRHELVRNAVAFLSDPSSQSSSLAQKIQFLEAKGLTPTEIEDALRQASLSSAAKANASYPQPVYGPMPYQLAQPPPGQWDWRDYFITAVVSGAVTYGAVSLFRKYISPHLQPPDVTAYEADKDALTAQFDAAEALLKEIQAETAAVKVAVEEQRSQVEKVTQDVEAAVKEMRESEVKARDEMREIRSEVTNIHEMLPKMIEKNKEAQSQSLGELQQELKSLKALLLSRGPAAPSTPPIPAFPSFPPKPTIPAWQLAAGDSRSSTPPVPALSPTLNGKGKEVDVGNTPDAPAQ